MSKYDPSARILAVLFVFVAIVCGVLWKCETCGVNVVQQLMVSRKQPGRDAPSAGAVTPSPSTTTTTPRTELRENLKRAASKNSNKGVEEFYRVAGRLRCPQPQRYTKEEVAQHHTEDDLWIVVDGNVLDVSSFVQQHPGGDMLLDGAGGQDMATVFSHFHDPSSVRLLESFCIGRVRQV
ncbi:hypothetical protein JKF63_05521 [Porcisia hertigi]|uniref:Cytochrome b5 heme-binding domain-containing protein n=1 Tax=Porcisia hertigi TaxID=2761500 RepID=A0A836LGM3_9TRYP|nr:hypothetical protein JKF63_05521 [Porcisia hertigi]